MTQYKKGDVVLVTKRNKKAFSPEHISLLKLLVDPTPTGRWNDYIVMQINYARKKISWPHSLINRDFPPESSANLEFATDIESIVNFKKDYIEAVFELGYTFKG